MVYLAGILLFLNTGAAAEEHPLKSNTLRVHKTHPLVREENKLTPAQNGPVLQQLWENYRELKRNTSKLANRLEKNNSQESEGVLLSNSKHTSS